MLVLALDTSADIAVSLVQDPGARSPVGGSCVVLAARRSSEQRRHAEMLAPMIVEVLGDAGVDRRELSAVVVGTGPAPFTGLRAGLVTARTLALALGLPCHGVCSLDALAAEAFAGGATTQEVLVATDARRRELYVARYRRSTEPPDADADSARPAGWGDVEVLAGPAVIRPQDVADDPSWAADAVVGAGALLYSDHLTGRATPTVPDPAVLARLAIGRVARGIDLPSEPLYLRRPDVTPSAGRQRVTR